MSRIKLEEAWGGGKTVSMNKFSFEALANLRGKVAEPIPLSEKNCIASARLKVRDKADCHSAQEGKSEI